ncbi:MAG TPA: DUF2804 domain-containing protein [Acidimicrobiales bacterium]|nr:DUF2804 domain-containing protein [Acidimicrobiales bacterium]
MSAGPELPPAPSAAVSGGEVAFGAYVGRCADVDWSGAATKAAWRLRQWKRWHYVSITGPEVILAVAVVDLGWAGSCFTYLFDRRQGRLLADLSMTAPGGRGITVAGPSGGGALTECRSRRLFVQLRGEDGGRWRLEARSPACTVDATLVETDAGPTMCAVAPVPGGVADCTHKTPALAVEGLASAGGVRFDLHGATGALDHTSGLLARTTSWRWASAGDRRSAFNLTEGFTAPVENVLWHEGQVQALGPVQFAFDPRRPQAPWAITGPSGSVDLEFVPEGIRASDVRLVVARSRYVQPVGTFRGTVGGVRIEAMAGVTEDHLARW